MAERLSISDVLRIVEARTKIIGASSVVIGTAYSTWVTRRLSFGILALMLGGTLAVDLGTAGFNSYFDFVRGVDTVETDRDGYKVLVHRDVDPRIALRIAWAAFGLGAVFGLVLGASVGWEVVGVGVACMVVAYFYSGGPRPIAATPLGELFAGSFLGLVLVTLAAYVQTRSTPPDTMIIGLPSALLIADILTVNNTCDVEGDAKAGRMTLSIMLGPSRSRALIAGLVAAAYTLAFTLAIVRVLPIVSLAPLAAGALFARREIGRMHRRGYGHGTKGPSMGGISAIFMTYSAALVTSLLVDGLVVPSVWRSAAH